MKAASKAHAVEPGSPSCIPFRRDLLITCAYVMNREAVLRLGVSADGADDKRGTNENSLLVLLLANFQFTISTVSSGEPKTLLEFPGDSSDLRSSIDSAQLYDSK